MNVNSCGRVPYHINYKKTRKISNLSPSDTGAYIWSACVCICCICELWLPNLDSDTGTCSWCFLSYTSEGWDSSGVFSDKHLDEQLKNWNVRYKWRRGKPQYVLLLLKGKAEQFLSALSSLILLDEKEGLEILFIAIFLSLKKNSCCHSCGDTQFPQFLKSDLIWSVLLPVGVGFIGH